MPLITTDELVRGALILTFGSAAGGAALAFPESALWLVPAVMGMTGTALTVPAIRQEVRQALPDLARQTRELLPDSLPTMPRLSRRPALAPSPEPEPEPDTSRDPLFTALEESPHRLVIGHTGGGKTTLMHSMAVNWAANKERVLVLDPDASPGQWPGCSVRGAGDDYEGITQGLATVGREVERRRLARAEGQRQFAPAHIIIDECQDVIAECPDALPIIETIARRGRKLNMHLTMGVQDNQAKTLGLEGKTHLLRNLQTVDVMMHDGQRVAVVHRPGGEKETIPIPTLYDPDDFIVTKRQVPPAAQSQPSPDDLLSSLLADNVLVASGRHQNASACSVLDENSRTAEQNIESVLVASGRHQNDITVTVNARAEVGPARTRRTGRKLPNVKAMAARDKQARLISAYREAGADGETFRKAADRLGGDKTVTFPAWQSGRAKKEGKK